MNRGRVDLNLLFVPASYKEGDGAMLPFQLSEHVACLLQNRAIKRGPMQRHPAFTHFHPPSPAPPSPSLLFFLYFLALTFIHLPFFIISTSIHYTPIPHRPFFFSHQLSLIILTLILIRRTSCQQTRTSPTFLLSAVAWVVSCWGLSWKKLPCPILFSSAPLLSNPLVHLLLSFSPSLPAGPLSVRPF